MQTRDWKLRLVDWFAAYAEYGRQRGDSGGGVAVARLATRILPRMPEAWILLTKLRRNVTDEPNVQKTLEKALAKTRGAPQIKAELVRSLLDQGRLDEALATSEQVGRGEAGGSWLHVAKARIAAYEQKWDDFKRYAVEAVKRSEEYHRSHLLLEFGILGQRDDESQAWAIELLQKSLQLRETYLAHISLCAFFRGNDAELAQYHLAQARKLYQGSDESFRDLVAKAQGMVPFGGEFEKF